MPSLCKFEILEILDNLATWGFPSIYSGSTFPHHWREDDSSIWHRRSGEDATSQSKPHDTRCLPSCTRHSEHPASNSTIRAWTHCLLLRGDHVACSRHSFNGQHPTCLGSGGFEFHFGDKPNRPDIAMVTPCARRWGVFRGSTSWIVPAADHSCDVACSHSSWRAASCCDRHFDWCCKVWHACYGWHDGAVGQSFGLWWPCHCDDWSGADCPTMAAGVLPHLLVRYAVFVGIVANGFALIYHGFSH